VGHACLSRDYFISSRCFCFPSRARPVPGCTQQNPTINEAHPAATVWGVRRGDPCISESLHWTDSLYLLALTLCCPRRHLSRLFLLTPTTTGRLTPQGSTTALEQGTIRVAELLGSHCIRIGIATNPSQSTGPPFSTREVLAPRHGSHSQLHVRCGRRSPEHRELYSKVRLTSTRRGRGKCVSIY
jgi:hypothetical protein